MLIKIPPKRIKGTKKIILKDGILSSKEFFVDGKVNALKIEQEITKKIAYYKTTFMRDALGREIFSILESEKPLELINNRVIWNKNLI